MAKGPKNITGKKFDKPYLIEGDSKSDLRLLIGRVPYYLERYEFEKLKRQDSLLLTIAHLFLGSTISFAINIISKICTENPTGQEDYEPWEFYAFMISLVMMVLFYILNSKIPSERKKIINLIKEHFENT